MSRGDNMSSTIEGGLVECLVCKDVTDVYHSSAPSAHLDKKKRFKGEQRMDHGNQ